MGPARDITLSATLAPASAMPNKARKAAQDFEATFLAIMIEHQFETLGEDGPLGGGGGAGASAWRGLLSEEIGKSVARAGGVGIADQVMREILRLQGTAT